MASDPLLPAARLAAVLGAPAHRGTGGPRPAPAPGAPPTARPGRPPAVPPGSAADHPAGRLPGRPRGRPPSDDVDPAWLDDAPTEPLAAVRAPGAGTVGALLRKLVPRSWRGARVDPGRPGAIALALVVTVAAVVAGVAVWAERPRAEPVGGLPAVVVGAASGPAGSDVEASDVDGSAAAGSGVDSSGTATQPGPEAAAASLVVSVSGKVARPGLVQVPQGARVADVLVAAGGALPGTDLTALNLARRVADGEQVAVGVPAAPDAAAGPAGGDPAVPGAAGAGAPPATVDLNAATAEQLDALPGVGPVMVQRILAWRAQHGRFVRVEQLREVEGIGERRFAQLRELVTVR